MSIPPGKLQELQEIAYRVLSELPAGVHSSGYQRIRLMRRLVSETRHKGVKTFWGKVCWELGLLNHTASDMHDISSAARHVVHLKPS